MANDGKKICEAVLTELGREIDPTDLLTKCELYLRKLGNEQSGIKNIFQAVADLLNVSIKINEKEGEEEKKEEYDPKLTFKRENFWEVTDELGGDVCRQLFNLNERCAKKAEDNCSQKIREKEVDDEVLKVVANELEASITIVDDEANADQTGQAERQQSKSIEPDPITVKKDEKGNTDLWKVLEKNVNQKGQVRKACVEHLLNNDEMGKLGSWRDKHPDVHAYVAKINGTDYTDDFIFQAVANVKGKVVELVESGNDKQEGLPRKPSVLNRFLPKPKHRVILNKSEEEFCNIYDFHKDSEKGNSGENCSIPWIVIPKLLSTAILFGAVGFGTITSKSTLLVLANAYTQDYSMSTCPKIVEGGEEHYNYNRYTVMLILMTCLCTPDVVSFLYALQRILKTSTEYPLFKAKTEQTKRLDPKVSIIGSLLLGAIPEILHAIGLTFLVLQVFPYVDSAVATMTFALVTISGAFSIFVPRKDQGTRFSPTSVLIFVLSLVFLASSYVVALWMTLKTSGSLTAAFSFLSPLMISCRHVGNFIELKKENDGEESYLMNVKKVLENRRYKTSAIYALIRLALIVAFCFLIYLHIDGNGVVIKHNGPVKIRFVEGTRLTRKCERITTAFRNTGIVNIVSSFFAFFFGFIACQAKVQILALNIPTFMSYIIMIFLTSWFTTFSDGETVTEFFSLAFIHPEVNQYIDWKKYDEELKWQLIVGGVLSILGFFGATWHSWKGNKQARARVEKLFTKPVYPVISEEMLLNRQISNKEIYHDATDSVQTSQPSYIYICTTIYHESAAEIKQILTSIMRLVDYNQTGDTQFGFEVHIWIDDAIDKSQKNRLITNTYVKTLLEMIPEAARSIGSKNEDFLNIKAHSGTASLTPYGGRYEYDLPNGKSLYVHMKDTRKVKQKKRWSQCMYLYYILKFKKLEKQKENTYILALDGDVDFKPEAVTFVLEVMGKHNIKEVGAVCGRIHPLGYGPVYWYQKFEYAVGHWLQKTAEDVLGCVLCSPGCFSLFRTDALELRQVAATYSTESTEGKHKIQYDQGEDRWLCTLLLKAGKRIEYAANADANTNAPTEFAEFFKQRRRWAPSTMANILDVLLNSKNARKNNNSITLAYVVYQWALLAASLLGPSTVVLVIQGALQYVFGMNAIGALMLALIPVVIYIIICYTMQEKYQLAVARILTLAYALVMMVVFIGVVGQMVRSLLNPSSVFLLFMIALFSITGLLHPAEISCLVYGVMYYLCVPSAFILLPIYSYCNMHVVSWGTRESSEDDKKKKKKKKSEKDEESFNCGFGNVCKCLICVTTTATTADAKIHTDEISVAKTSTKDTEKNAGENVVKKEHEKDEKKQIEKQVKIMMPVEDTAEQEQQPSTSTKLEENAVEKKTEQKQKKKTRLTLKLAGKAVIAGNRFSGGPDRANLRKEVQRRGKSITEEEREVWDRVIAKYLKPNLREDSDKMDKETKNLRNLMSGAYIFINGLWLALTFSLAMIIEDANISYYDKNGNEVVLNPLAFSFLIFFLVILVIQFAAMLFHRFDTFIYLMAGTPWPWIKDSTDNNNGKSSDEEEGSNRSNHEGSDHTSRQGGHDGPGQKPDEESSLDKRPGKKNNKVAPGQGNELKGPGGSRQAAKQKVSYASDQA